MPFKDRIRITDVSPRDGLQNEERTVSTEEKINLIHLLAKACVDEIEATSFVSPKWVPQLADAAEVLAGIGEIEPLISALVPNMKGMEAALACREKTGYPNKIALFTAASETFARKNTNASIAETIERFEPVVELAKQHEIPVRGYVSCAYECPFEGFVRPGAVADVSKRLVDIGVDEIDLGDTIGAAVPETTVFLLKVVMPAIEGIPVTLHLHDTHGRALDCVRIALQLGVRSFDGSAGGLGGCPYASTDTTRAPGNVETMQLARTVIGEGFQCRVKPGGIARASSYALNIVHPMPLP